MANKSRFYISEGSIRSLFSKSIKKVFSKEEIGEVLEENRHIWRLPAYMNVNKFLDKLINKEILTEKEVNFEGYFPDKIRYVTQSASVFQVSLSLVNKSYLSHYTAVFLHGLTTQVPKVIYLSFEQSQKNSRYSSLTQEAIEAAFSKPQRISNSVAILEDNKIVIHNSMFTNRIGVYSHNGLTLTNLERTLIDIAVRPAYCGGTRNVLEVYRNAIDKISINKLTATLLKINYIYPYHQVIGFYLEKAGVNDNKLEKLRNMRSNFDFYLAHDIKEIDYNEKWKIFHPKGI